MFLVLCQLLSAETWRGNRGSGIVFKTFVLQQFSWIIEGPLNLFPNKTELGAGVTVCPSSSIVHSVWIYSPFQEPRSRTCSEDCGAVTGPDQGTRPRSQVSPDWPRHAAILTSDWLLQVRCRGRTCRWRRAPRGRRGCPGPRRWRSPCRPLLCTRCWGSPPPGTRPGDHLMHSVHLKLITFGTK